MNRLKKVRIYYVIPFVIMLCACHKNERILREFRKKALETYAELNETPTVNSRFDSNDPLGSNDPIRKKSHDSLQALQPIIAGGSDLTVYSMLSRYSGKIDFASL